jgi:hypothetical protein
MCDQPGNRPPARGFETAYGATCASFSGGKCTVWAKRQSHPPFITRKLHYKVEASFCKFAREFLQGAPKGYIIERVPAQFASTAPRRRKPPKTSKK